MRKTAAPGNGTAPDTSGKGFHETLTETRVKFRVDKAVRHKRVARRRYLSYLWAGLLFLGIALLVTVLISKAFFYKPYRTETGIEVSQTIVAPFPLLVEDEEAYRKKVEKEAGETPRCYQYDSRVEGKILNALDGVQNEILNTPDARPESRQLFRENLKRQLGLTLSDEITTTLIRIGNDRRFYENLKLLVKDLMTNRGVIDDKYTYQTYEKNRRIKVTSKDLQLPTGFSSSRMIEYPEELPTFLNRSLSVYFPGARAANLSAARDLVSSLIEPNFTFRPDLTDRERKTRIAMVKKVTRRFNKGDVIIKEGERIDLHASSALSRLNSRMRNAFFMQMLANLILVLIIFGFVAFFVHKYRPDLKFTYSNVILISLPVLLALGLGRLAIQIQGPAHPLVGYAFPAGIIGILAVIILDARIAFLLVSWGAFLFGLSLDMNFKATLVAFIGGVTSVLSLYNVRERKEMILAGVRIALVNFVSIIILESVADPTGDLRIYARQAAWWGVGNGIACGFIAFPALKIFEIFFNVVTDVRLLELTGIRQPLLVELEEKAPGSYLHSLNVAKLAEPAAIAVGVNYLLVRTGAYYHDVGKIVKAKYYSENQANPEDKKIYHNITPHMSVLIIKKHIKEGIELAEKAGLPQAVIDFIPQHHGTSLIRYFYDLAKKRFEEGKINDPLREEDFRYPGPKPQTIETAIVMLADTVEATSTSRLSQAHVDEDDIRRVVHESVLRQFNDGQFDECNMTLRDLHIIEESFVKTLLSRFHYRVHYPGGGRSNNREEKKANGNKIKS